MFCVFLFMHIHVCVDWQADRKAHHNALERKRRDHIKESFVSLRDTIPTLRHEKVCVVVTWGGLLTPQ